MKDVRFEEIHNFVLNNLSYLKDLLFHENNMLRKEVSDKWIYHANTYGDLSVNISHSFREKIYVIHEVIALSVLKDNTKSVSEYLQIHLEPIYEEIKKKQKRRSKILGKWYNYELNKLEYELEDGNFVTIDGLLRPPILDTIWEVLPDFVYLLYNVGEYRQKKLIEFRNED